jgi:hypothetical protein
VGSFCFVHLFRVTKIIADSFSYTLLISPGLSEFEKGVFHTDVKIVMGTRSIFKKTKVITLTPLEKDSLYFLATNQTVILKLLPLVTNDGKPED